MNGNGVGVPTPMEIVFSFNVAGAFGPMHPASKTYIKHLIRSLDDTQLLPKILSVNPLSKTKTRIAVFAHGLHKHSMDGIKRVDFTDDVNVLRQFVTMTWPGMKWGAKEHCYELVLRKAKSLSWTPCSKRALVLVGCTRPHDDGHHVGSAERIHWRVEARCLAQMDIPVYTVEVKLQNEGSDFYRELAEITEGCHVTLEQLTPMEDVITAIVSHLAGPDQLEEAITTVDSRMLQDFEQEVLDRPQDHYSSDMTQLFAALRHHFHVITTSLSDSPTPGTPQGSDFGDDIDDSDGGEEVTSPDPEVIEAPTNRSVPGSSAQSHTETPRLKRSKTAPATVRTQTETRVSSGAKSFLNHETEVRRVESPSKRSSLRRGVTLWNLDDRQGESRAEELLLKGESPSARVYKIGKDPPAKRENISPRTFTLRHLSWSPWKLIISPTFPSEARPTDWEPRSDPPHQHGYRRKTIADNDDNPPAALYELALKTDTAPRKRVVYHVFLSEPLRGSPWENQLLGRGGIQQEVSEAVRKKCSVFVRRAILAQGGGRTQTMVQTALNKYDYAWNRSQVCARRSARRVEFF